MKDDIVIEHRTGRKDDFKVVIEFDEPREQWNPTNEEVFKWLDLFFTSEDYEFGEGGYGRWVPWYYITMIVMGYEDVAYDAYGKRGYDALEHFEDAVDEHADEVLEEILRMKRKERAGTTPRDARLPIRESGD